MLWLGLPDYDSKTLNFASLTVLEFDCESGDLQRIQKYNASISMASILELEAMFEVDFDRSDPENYVIGDVINGPQSLPDYHLYVTQAGALIWSESSLNDGDPAYAPQLPSMRIREKFGFPLQAKDYTPIFERIHNAGSSIGLKYIDYIPDTTIPSKVQYAIPDYDSANTLTSLSLLTLDLQDGRVSERIHLTTSTDSNRILEEEARFERDFNFDNNIMLLPQSGQWQYRDDLSSSSSSDDPYVEIVEFSKKDNITGLNVRYFGAIFDRAGALYGLTADDLAPYGININDGWNPADHNGQTLTNHLNNHDGTNLLQISPSLSGNYLENTWSYHDDFLSIYKDSNNDNVLDPSDPLIAELDTGYNWSNLHQIDNNLGAWHMDQNGTFTMPNNADLTVSSFHIPLNPFGGSGNLSFS